MRLYVAKSVTYDGASVSSATHFSITPSTTKVTDPGVAGSPGVHEELAVGHEIQVQIFGSDYSELLDLVGSTAATLVCKAIGDNGNERTFTVSDVVFNDPPAADVPMRDEAAGGTALRHTIAGRVVGWSAGDGISDKLSVA